MNAPLHAQSADELELLKSLTPEQRQALLDNMANQGDEGDAKDSGGTSDRRDSNANKRGQAKPNGTRTKATDQKPRALEQDAEPVLEPGSTVVIETAPPKLKLGPDGKPLANQPEPEPLEEAASVRLQRIAEGNPYRLDSEGNLLLTGLPPIQLSGLTDAQATLRLKNEPLLRDLSLKVTALPIEAEALEKLKPYGYEVFENPDSTFAPTTDIPVPSEYVLGPGDSLRVNLVGNQNKRLTLTVDRNGEINFPELGPINLAGMRFEDAKDMVERQVSEQMIGVRANVTMGTLRTLQVFILGEAKLPGSYSLSSLSTMTNALFAAGGINEIGSLRNVQLKRQGKVVTTLDLYDLLLAGDTSHDERLLSGDVIFIPPVGATVGVSGAVKRPAIYELKLERDANTLVAIAGGLAADAEGAHAVIERIRGGRDRVTIDVDLSSSKGTGVTLQSGDVLKVPFVKKDFAVAVRIDGHVYRPGNIGFKPGMRLSDAISSVDDLKPDADLHYVLIRREVPPDRRLAVISADLSAALAHPRSKDDVELRGRDRITVFDLRSDRSSVVAPLIAELNRQSSAANPTPVVSVEGNVKAKGEYPLEPGMRVSDLLRAGGGLDDSAYTASAELARSEVVGGERRQTALINVDLGALKSGDAAADIELHPFDHLLVRQVPEWERTDFVEISGEVRFPGRYPIQRGETLRSVLERAGGLTDLAFAEGSVFTRKELREREQKQLDQLTERMRRDLAALALQASGSAATGAGNNNANPQALNVGESLLQQATQTKAVGRLVLSMDRVLAGEPGGENDIVLKDGDALAVPPRSQEVTVIGEVQNATSHIYERDRTRDDYLRLSGGTTPNAAADRIYVIRANGSVESQGDTRWFERLGAGDTNVRPGDTIVVPLDTERTLPLPLWTAVTQILYNIAVAVAAVKSF